MISEIEAGGKGSRIVKKKTRETIACTMIMDEGSVEYMWVGVSNGDIRKYGGVGEGGR